MAHDAYVETCDTLYSDHWPVVVDFIIPLADDDDDGDGDDKEDDDDGGSSAFVRTNSLLSALVCLVVFLVGYM